MFFVTSDLHLGHQNATTFRDLGDVDQMNQAILDGINSTCGPDDDLLILGDAVMGQFVDTVLLIKDIRCRVHLLGGNHDKFTAAYGDKRPAKRDDWKRRYLDAGFATVADGHLRLTVDGVDVLLSHYPYTGDHGDVDRFPDSRPVDTGLPLLHGHLHSKPQDALRGRSLDVGVDAHGFRPLLLTDAVRRVRGAA